MIKNFIFLNILFISICYGQAGVVWTPSSNDLSATGQDAYDPQIAIDLQGRAIAIWTRYDGSNYIIQAAYSIDGGISWTASSNDLSAAGQDAYAQQIAIDSTGRAIVTWARNDGSDYIIQAGYSTDGGVSWTASSNDLSAAGQDALVPQIAIDSTGRAIVVWKRHDGVTVVIQAAYSTDGGASWTASSNNVSGPSAPGQEADAPQIAIDSTNRAIAVWRKFDGTAMVVQAAYSTDGGASWTASSNDLSASIAGYVAHNPHIAIDSTNRAIAIWNVFDGGEYTVQAAYSTNGGVSWTASSNDLSAAGHDGRIPQIAIDSTNRAIVVWRYDESNYTIQAAYSTNGGVSWTASSNDLSAVGEDASEPQIAISSRDDRAIAIWKRYDGSNQIIQAAYSTNGGVSWTASSNDLSAAGQDADDPQIAISVIGRAIAVWRRNDGSDYIVQAAYSGSLAQGYGVRSVVNLFLQKDVVDYIYWDEISTAVLYRIYKDSSFRELLYEGAASNFYYHGRKKGSTDYYYINYVTADGSELELSTVTVN